MHLRLFHRCAALVASSTLALAQTSDAALRFHGTGQSQQDRVRIAVDDDAPGAASTPLDVGSGAFTIELWIRGTLEDNATSHSGGAGSFPDARWRNGNVIVDRDVAGGSERDFGISIAGGRVRFGTGRGDAPGQDASENTIEGGVGVLDGAWHHVACVRDVDHGGRKLIVVDGVIDFTSPVATSTADLSYPDAGVPGSSTPWGRYLVLGAEKHDSGPSHPSFAGRLDELRVWSTARRASEISANRFRVIAPGTVGLVASYRFEEGQGTAVLDSSSASSPSGELVAGVPGNGEWTLRSADPSNTAPISGGGLPSGFTKTLVAEGLIEPVALAFAPDGRLFVAQRDGVVRVVRDGALLSTPVIAIPVDVQGGERGLAGLCVDPGFAANGWIYAYFTTPEPRNVVARFTVVGDTAALGSRYLVWRNPSLAAEYHHGGCVAFGPDGELYVSTGDQLDSSSARNLGLAHGKILRVRPDGSIPAGNPFAGVPGALPEIWASGFRNPFRFAFDAVGGSMWVGDVGGNNASSWEELDRVVAGADFGWPMQEGPVCYTGSCAGIVRPRWSYRHDDPAHVPGLAQGAIVVGPVYRDTAFPPAYHGRLFVGDYANRWIRTLAFDAHGHVVADEPFEEAPGASAVVDLDVGPDGALYYVAHGVPWGTDPGSARVFRVEYAPSTNAPPIAIASATPIAGSAPLVVQFDGSASLDPDNGPHPLRYQWSFGDGAEASVATPAHVYAAAGAYSATLTVGDGSAVSTSTPIAITVGGAPIVTMIEPVEGRVYHAGEVIAFDATAVDPEDGVLSPSAFVWQVELVHGGHTHPFLGPIANVTSGSFAIPSSGHGPENAYYRLTLSVTDSDLLTTATTRDLTPVPSVLRVDSVPIAANLLLDGAPLPTPATYTSVLGFVHQLDAPAIVTNGAQSFGFARWSTGATSLSLAYAAPYGGAAIRAVYEPVDVIDVEVAVASPARNAEYFAPNGQQHADALDAGALCIGRDAAGALQSAFELRLDVPGGVRVLSASIELVAGGIAGAPVECNVYAYDVGDAPPFSAGSPVPLTRASPLVRTSLSWSIPVHAPGTAFSSPDLASLLQCVLDRPDWRAGRFVGFVFDGRPTSAPARAWVRNVASGSPARLHVRYARSTGAESATHTSGL